MKLSRQIFSILLALLFITVNASAAGKKRVAILELTAKNAPQTYAEIVRDILEVNLHKTGTFEVLERNQMNVILKEQGLQVSGCVDTSCAVEIGKVLSADMVVVGSLFKIQNYSISVKLVDVKNSNIIVADTEKVDSEADIENAVNRLSIRIAKLISEKTNGQTEPAEKPETKETPEKEERRDEPPSQPLPFDICVSINGSYLMPFRDFSDLVGPGYGGALSAGISYKNINIGIQTGYWYFPGSTDNTDSFTMIPAHIYAGYRFTFIDSIAITPVVSGGWCYNTVKYDKDGIPAGEKAEYSSESLWEPFAKGGINVGIIPGGNFEIFAGCEYGSIFEEDGRLEFLIISAGVKGAF